MSPDGRRVRRRAFLAGSSCLAAVLVLCAVGSRGGRDYDLALLPYSLGLLCAAFVLGFRWTLWAHRPPTALYLKRGLELLFLRPRLAFAALFARAATSHLVAHTFIARRSVARWFAHFNLAWGSILATVVTVPLVLGWLHFEASGGVPASYRVVLFGATIDEFALDSLKRHVMFNLLNLSAVMVIVGCALALKRRLTNPGSIARQQFAQDLLPLLLLLVVSITGLLMTVSVHAFAGRGYPALSLIHAVVVGGTLVYVPFGKLFHPFQRPAHVAVALYKRAGQDAPAERCRSCQEPFASSQHVRDLKQVTADLGIDGQQPLPIGDYAFVCPRCRRRLLGFSQGLLVNPALIGAPAGTEG